MHFVRPTTLAAFALIAPALAQLTIRPPGGSGYIDVTHNGGIHSDGCLNENGEWTVNPDNCGLFFGNGQGGIVTGSGGYIVLDEDSNVTPTTGTWTTAWVGTSVNSGNNLTYLQAQIGHTGTQPWGGPVWFTDSQPEGDDVATPNGHAWESDVQVILSWRSTV